MKQTAKQNLVPVAGGGLAAMLADASALENQILVLAHDNDGEIDAHLDGLLANLQQDIALKTDRYKFVMDRLETTAAMLDQRADEIYRAAKALENVRDAMKERVKVTMLAMGVDELKGDTWRFKLTKTKGRLVLDGPTVDKLGSDVTATVLEVLEHATAYRDKHRAADAGGAGSELNALVSAVDKLEALEAGGFAKYTSLKFVVEPKKDLIREQLEANQPVPGAEIEVGYQLRPYVNKVGA